MKYTHSWDGEKDFKEEFMQIIRILVFTLSLLMLYTSGFASDFKIVPPEYNEDGTEIYFPNELGYVLSCDNDPGVPYSITVDVGNRLPDSGNIVRIPIKDVLPASVGISKWFCAAQAYYTFAPDNKSRHSNEIFFVAEDGVSIKYVTPSPPKFGFDK